MNFCFQRFNLISFSFLFAGLLSMTLRVTAADAPAPALSLSYPSVQQGNVFSEAPIHVKAEIKNAKGGALTGSTTFTVTDQNGNQAATWTEDIQGDGIATIEHDVALTRFGLYTVDGTATLADGTKAGQKMLLAYVPPQRELTEAEKLASPYGINYHRFDPRFFDAFKKAGVYWYRCYAFALDDMDNAKGADKSYTGGGNFSAVIDDYAKHGMYILPILNAIHPPDVKDPAHPVLGPPPGWDTKLRDVVSTFPSVKFWELDNEYDINLGNKTEAPVHWQNYQLYHKKFGEIVDSASGGKSTAVENGRSEISIPEVTEYVKSGNFDHIGVVNSHHYTGSDPPELNSYNYNTGQHASNLAPGTFFDMLKAMKAAGQADGKKRQSWLTEFGWDTRFKPMVSDAEQAAYLQRAFLLIIASGTDKGFWFYNFDLPPQGYFNGCGVMTVDRQPKLSFSAMAGMTSILPAPVYVGSINAGPNTAGYVFENDGKLIAGLWSIKGKGPKVTFHAQELRDYLGNKLDGLSIDLTIAPVYAIGLSKDDPFFRQTAYELETPHRVEAAAGDMGSVILVLRNQRAQEIKATLSLTLPAGWTSDKDKSGVTITVAPGAEQKIALLYTINPDEALGVKEMTVTCQEGADTIKTIPVTVSVVPHFDYQVGSISGAPGKTSVPVTIHNRTAFPLDGALTIKVPQSWQAPASVPIKGIQPGETRITPVEVAWGSDWKEGESASVTFQPSKGKSEELPLIPAEYHLNKVASMTLDGDLSHWPKEDEMPGWILGSTSGPGKARIWLAWAPEGIYGAVEVHDSTRKVDDPASFWDGDSLELFISAKGGEPSINMSPDDHQFWFMPDFKKNRVYVGEWRTKDNHPDAKFDLPGIKSAAKQTDDGYVMEFLLPASAIPNFNPTAGMAFRVNINLGIYGTGGKREVYWPLNKATGAGDHPNQWGVLKLND